MPQELMLDKSDKGNKEEVDVTCILMKAEFSILSQKVPSLLPRPELPTAQTHIWRRRAASDLAMMGDNQPEALLPPPRLPRGS